MFDRISAFGFKNGTYIDCRMVPSCCWHNGKSTTLEPYQERSIEMCEFCLKHGEGKKWYLQAKKNCTSAVALLRKHGAKE